MKKVRTDYAFLNKKTQSYYTLTVNEETENNISVHEYGEPCSGVLKQWGSREELIEELEFIIAAIKSSKTL